MHLRGILRLRDLSISSSYLKGSAMFARKVKSADLSVSIQRFADLHRECTSRAKHLRLALDALCVPVSFAEMNRKGIIIRSFYEGFINFAQLRRIRLSG